MAKTEISGWAAWHPERGFEQPFHYEGALAYVRPDDATEEVRDLNREAGQNTRKGWRMVPVTIVKVEQP